MLSLFTVTSAISHSEPWTVSLVHTLSFWCLWFFFIPAIVLVSLRFPLERPHLFPQIVLHLFVGLMVLMLSQLAYRTCLPLPPAPSEMANNSPPPSRARFTDMRTIPDLLMYLVTTSSCVAFAHFRKSQERERQAIELAASLAQAKLQALRMQINPHFLFNTLNAISTLVHTNPQTADEMIADLGELLRASLENSGDHEISLSGELALLRRYLAIEQRRFGPRLKVEQFVTPEVLAARVPTLILQPLVENAIRHGVEKQTEVGAIVIHAERDGSHLKLSVSDNGKKPFNAAALNGDRPGIGLANTRARLQQLYGKEQSFSVGDGELGGWAVVLKIPLHLGTSGKGTA